MGYIIDIEMLLNGIQITLFRIFRIGLFTETTSENSFYTTFSLGISKLGIQTTITWGHYICTERD
jgi:hypothetical protein